jgi:hypothetical protein
VLGWGGGDSLGVGAAASSLVVTELLQRQTANDHLPSSSTSVNMYGYAPPPMVPAPGNAAWPLPCGVFLELVWKPQNQKRLERLESSYYYSFFLPITICIKIIQVLYFLTLKTNVKISIAELKCSI